MKESKSSISEAQSYQEIGEYWDTHDLSEQWEQTEAVEFEVDIESEKTYYDVETALSAKLRSIAERQGVSAETLFNLWVQEKVGKETMRE